MKKLGDFLTVTDVHLGDTRINLRQPCDFVCDIDGTVADLTHRRRFVVDKPKNWKAFESLAHLDKPIEHVISWVCTLQEAGFRLIMSSGRSEHQRDLTRFWLERYGLKPEKLYMRANRDYRGDDIVKQEILERMREDGYHPAFSFDDRDRVVKMWRDNNVTCIQVAEGDF